MPRFLILFFGFLALCLLAWLCFGMQRPQIEGDIAQRLTASLQAAEIGGARVEVEGQDVTLLGEVASEAAKREAGELAAALPGVRVVYDRLGAFSEASPVATDLLPSEDETAEVVVTEAARPEEEVPGPGEAPIEQESARPESATSPVSEQQKRQAQTKLDTLMALGRVEFLTSSDELIVQSRTILDEAAKIIRDVPGVTIEIGGHTDSRGAATANLDLSRRRSESVREYLIREGVTGDRLRAAGYGETQPIASNDTIQGRRTNRRIEFRILGEDPE